MKRRPDDTAPWMPGFRYGALLPALSLNFLVRDPEASAAFYPIPPASTTTGLQPAPARAP